MEALAQQFAERGVRLYVQKKSVKRVNFRVKAGELHVSAPVWLSDDELIAMIGERLAWAAAASEKLQRKSAQQKTLLWGKPFDVRQTAANFGMSPRKLANTSDDALVLWVYRQALTEKLAELAQKWQPVVGKSAHEIRLKKMTSRWGVCNTRDKRIWLSVYLAAYPYECTEYVFVHELCHLHHANHSAAFWQCVQAAMPDYRFWHDYLKRGGVAAL
ncbi:hypothetical protein B0181_04120 [Moraxella caviae]|uniref:YgjP-like metallopeptidase domain-containing protein n=1 Tax=Moraxella caviae TaxID=34060 RepID=A0A1T0A565_9GAMM|nr:hypothetical protein B0181_04120 [Moraxella caviae]